MGKIADLLAAQHIVLALQQKKQMLALDRQFESLESQVATLKAENLKLQAEVNPLKREVERLKNEVQKQSSSAQNVHPLGYVCDHCGSGKLKRVGNRPDPLFADIGGKLAVFRCLECGDESTYSI